MVMDLLIDLWKKKQKTIVIITHDPNVANAAERILNMRDGKLVRNHKLAKESVWSEELEKKS